jgi:hypothetical protein
MVLEVLNPQGLSIAYHGSPQNKNKPSKPHENYNELLCLIISQESKTVQGFNSTRCGLK